MPGIVRAGRPRSREAIVHTLDREHGLHHAQQSGKKSCASLKNHSPLEGESARQGRSPQSSRRGGKRGVPGVTTSGTAINPSGVGRITTRNVLEVDPVHRSVRRKAMQTLQRTTWCLCAVLLLSPATWAQDRGTGREAAVRRAVGARKAMQDRLRAIRLSQSNPTRSLLKLQSHLQQAHQQGAEDGDYDNYSIVIPLVTNEDGARTNVGLNNFTRYSVQKGADPEASVLQSACTIHPETWTARASIPLDRTRCCRSTDIMSHSAMRTGGPGGGAATTGWLLIFSDEPITAWASVILDRVNNDPAMELAIADQIFKPSAFVESPRGLPPTRFSSSLQSRRGPSNPGWRWSTSAAGQDGSGSSSLTETGSCKSPCLPLMSEQTACL